MTKLPRAVLRVQHCLLSALFTVAGCGDLAADTERAVLRQEADGVVSITPDALPEETTADIRGVVVSKVLTQFGPNGPRIDRFGGAPMRVIGRQIAGEEPGTRQDLAASWQAGWNRLGLLIRVSVTDEKTVSDSPSPWEDDAVEIFLDGDNSKGATYDGSNDYHLVIRPGDKPTVELGLHSATDTTGIEVEGSSLAGRRSVEVLVPWTLLGGTPAKGRQIGIDVQVDDDDDGGARDSKLATFSGADEAWMNPGSFGTLTLGAAFDTIGGHSVGLTVVDAQTLQPIPQARVLLAPFRAFSRSGTVSTDALGHVQFGSCDGGSVVPVIYDVAGVYVSVFAEGYVEIFDAFLSAQPLVGYCASMERTIRLAPSQTK